jgi:hypothetical protein
MFKNLPRYPSIAAVRLLTAPRSVETKRGGPLDGFHWPSQKRCPPAANSQSEGK